MNLNGASYTVTMTGFTTATEGTAADRDGTNGSFTFTVKLYKGNDTGNIATSTYAEATVTISNGTVTATPYTKWAVTVNAEDGGTPKTGDSSVLGLWEISLCTSFAGCLALTTWQIRRRREEEALQIIEK